MENPREKIIDAMKHLLIICNDGKEGYRNASEDVEAEELKSIFNRYSIQRAGFAVEIKTILRNLGEDVDNLEGGPMGTLHRTWMDVKSALSGKDNGAILSACVTGEKVALEAYDDLLEDSNIEWGSKNILIMQREEIADALMTIQNLEKQYA